MFGLALAGAIIIEHGAKDVSGVFGGSSTSSAAASAPASSGSAPSSGAGSVTPSMLSQVGGKYGWTGGQLSDWLKVIMAESGGNPQARNPSSGAFGIGQFLGGTLTEYAPYGATSANPLNQLEAMAKYIHDRYGTPTAAWAHEQADHWY